MFYHSRKPAVPQIPHDHSHHAGQWPGSPVNLSPWHICAEKCLPGRVHVGPWRWWVAPEGSDSSTQVVGSAGWLPLINSLLMIKQVGMSVYSLLMDTYSAWEFTSRHGELWWFTLNFWCRVTIMHYAWLLISAHHELFRTVASWLWNQCCLLLLIEFGYIHITYTLFVRPLSAEQIPLS